MVANNKGPTELDTFLPHDGSNLKDGALTAKYKVKITPKDAENGMLNGKSFDPFVERKVDNPTTNGDTLTHLLKASLGTGILSMPFAFRSAGLVNGILFTILVALICTHCSYILVKCAHVLYYKTRRTQMSFADVAEHSLAEGPKQFRFLKKFARYTVDVGLFVTYFGTCSAYAVIVAKNFKEVLDFHFWPDLPEPDQLNIRIVIACLLVPFILLTWVPDLKYLAPVSMIANVFMALGLGTVFYWLGTKLLASDRITPDYVLFENVSEYPAFFSITIFAIEAIGVVMPLENKMKTPQNFVGIFGVLNKGMAGVSVVYIILGLLGFLNDPIRNPEVDMITLEMPMKGVSNINSLLAQGVRILVGLAVFCTFCLQYFVCLDIAWGWIKGFFPKKPTLANYSLRTVMVIACIGLAIAVPKITPVIGLIGAFCFSILGLLVPCALETVVYWDKGFGRFNWMIIKNIIISVFAIFALVFGSKAAIADIIKVFIDTKK